MQTLTDRIADAMHTQDGEPLSDRECAALAANAARTVELHVISILRRALKDGRVECQRKAINASERVEGLQRALAELKETL